MSRYGMIFVTKKFPVVLVGIGSGLTYAPQGMTHYAVEDLGIMQTSLICPSFLPSTRSRPK